jgi:hypothetical protein
MAIISNAGANCETIRISAFRGDRSRPFVTAFQNKLRDEKIGRGPGPTREECLLYLGHAAVSIDGGFTNYGFNPDGGGIAFWELLDRLKRGDRFPGSVRDDTWAFAAARNLGLPLRSFDILVPQAVFQEFQSTLDQERQKSQYYYGFPNGDGDCNCTTWLERLGLPLLTGRMEELIALPAMSSNPSRRFGLCIP